MADRNDDDVRESVSKAYAEAIAKTGSSGCCSTGSGATLRGYRKEDLDALPESLRGSSFGCGNPLAFADVQEGQTVVDLGSGAGLDLLVAARRVGPTGRVIGVDMTGEMIERARQNVSEAGFSETVEVRRGVIEELPIEDASADWVISNCVINLSPDKPRVFAEIARVLRPGGAMLVSDLVVDALPDWVRENEALYSTCIAGAISESEYLSGLAGAGLREIEVRDRVVYDAQALAALLGSDELSALLSSAGASCELLERAAADLAGKVQSLRIFARRTDS